MNRKQFKSIQNQAAKVVGRAVAKEQFQRRDAFVRVAGAFIHQASATLLLV